MSAMLLLSAGVLALVTLSVVIARARRRHMPDALHPAALRRLVERHAKEQVGEE